MALDTRNKRSSAIALGSPWRGMWPEPDGEIAAADRIHIGLYYAGLELVAEEPEPEEPQRGKGGRLRFIYIDDPDRKKPKPKAPPRPKPVVLEARQLDEFELALPGFSPFTVDPATRARVLRTLRMRETLPPPPQPEPSKISVEEQLMQHFLESIGAPQIAEDENLPFMLARFLRLGK